MSTKEIVREIKTFALPNSIAAAHANAEYYWNALTKLEKEVSRIRNIWHFHHAYYQHLLEKEFNDGDSKSEE